MQTLTKAAALRWLDRNVGRTFDTVQVRPSGITWEPGQRTLSKKGSRVYALDGSVVSLTSSDVVLELADNHLKLEWQDEDGVTIHWTTYTVMPD